MADNRKYYYLKLKESYFDDDAIVLLEKYAGRRYLFQHSLEAVLEIAEKRREIAALTRISPTPPR